MDPGQLQNWLTIWNQLNWQRKAEDNSSVEDDSSRSCHFGVVWCRCTSGYEIGVPILRELPRWPHRAGRQQPSAAISEGVRAYALDPKNAEALWKKSEELAGRVVLRDVDNSGAY